MVANHSYPLEPKNCQNRGVEPWRCTSCQLPHALKPTATDRRCFRCSAPLERATQPRPRVGDDLGMVTDIELVALWFLALRQLSPAAISRLMADWPMVYRSPINA
jgi:hypothetical protein